MRGQPVSPSHPTASGCSAVSTTARRSCGMCPAEAASPSMPQSESSRLCGGLRATEWLALAFVGGVFAMLLWPAFQPVRSRGPSVCEMNLHQIAMALRYYHDRYGCFPPARVSDNLGRRLHSWRVLIL